MLGSNNFRKIIRRTSLAFLAFIWTLSCGVKKTNDALSIFLFYDEPISGYHVSGSFHPFGPTSETGQVELRFVPTSGGDTLLFSNVGCYEQDNPEYPIKFTGKNIYDYVFRDEFSGFHDGDTLVCHYYNTKRLGLESPLSYDAEFLFFDVDFDGENEFLTNDYYQGRCGNHYTVYEITTSGFVLKYAYPFDSITNETQFYPETKQICIRVDEDKFELVDL